MVVFLFLFIGLPVFANATNIQEQTNCRLVICFLHQSAAIWEQSVVLLTSLALKMFCMYVLVLVNIAAIKCAFSTNRKPTCACLFPQGPLIATAFTNGYHWECESVLCVCNCHTVLVPAELCVIWLLCVSAQSRRLRAGRSWSCFGAGLARLCPVLIFGWGGRTFTLVSATSSAPHWHLTELHLVARQRSTSTWKRSDGAHHCM